MNQEKKDRLIEDLNRNYRTVLSYGKDSLIPVGEFIVTDIIADDIPDDYKNLVSEKETARIVLTQIDNEKNQIVIPYDTFVSSFCKKAEKNADLLGIGSDLTYNIEDVEEELEWRMYLEDHLMRNLQEAELITLEECEATYTTNAEERSSNYSICPVDLGKYRERVMSREDKIATLKIINGTTKETRKEENGGFER